MQVPSRQQLQLPAYGMQAIPFVNVQPSFQPKFQRSMQATYSQPMLAFQPPICAARGHGPARAVSPTRHNRPPAVGLRGRAQCVPQLRLQAVHSLPYAPSLVPVIPLLQGPWPLPTQVPFDASMPLPGVDLKPWIKAAAEFSMNTDFDVSSVTCSHRMDLKELMQVMKDMSIGKRTIQALADKLMLHRILDNLDVAQMPALLCIEGVVSPTEIMKFVHGHLCGPEAQDVVIKPSHLSNGTGVIVVSRPKPEEVDSTIHFLTAHIQQFMSQKAGVHESVALRSLKPGFIVQPKYQSAVCFKTPLELRCIVLWGRARLAVWWWGRGFAPGEFPHRNAWLIRRPTKLHRPPDGGCEQGRGEHFELTPEDRWEVIHEHSGSNPGFDKALELFHTHISAIAACAEALATAVGAPFLRSDFFVGSSQWGVRLNEVAYGCGVDYQSRADDFSIVDDAPSIARILQEGMGQCRCRLPPDHFLKRLGVKGCSYAEATVTPLPAWAKPPLPPACASLGQDSADDCVVPEELCRTIHPVWKGRRRPSSPMQQTGRSRSLDEGMARAAILSQRGARTRNRSSSLSGRVRSDITEQPRRRPKAFTPRGGEHKEYATAADIDAVYKKSEELVRAMAAVECNAEDSLASYGARRNR